MSIFTSVNTFTYIGCPVVIRMDQGTENTKVAQVQYAFRAYHTDEFAAESSFRSAHLQLTLLVFLSIHVCIKYSQQFYVHTSRGLKAGGLSCGATNLNGGFIYSRYCVMQVTIKYQLIIYEKSQ